MASRWFVLWIAGFIISMVRQDGNELLWLVLAALTDAPNIATQVLQKLEQLPKSD